MEVSNLKSWKMARKVTSQIPTVHLRALKQRIMKEDDMEKGLDWLIN